MGFVADSPTSSPSGGHFVADDNSANSFGSNESDLVSNIGGAVAEPIAHMLSGAAGQITGDVAGLADNAIPGVSGLLEKLTGIKSPQELKAKISNAMTYEPKTTAGKTVESGIDTLLSPIGKGVNYVEGKVAPLLTTGLQASGALPQSTSSADQANTEDASKNLLDLFANVAAPSALGAITEPLAGKLSSIAENRAFAALGGNKSVLNDVTNKGKNIDAATAAGRYALDNGVISPLGRTDAMIDSAQSLKDAAGARQGAVQDTVSDPANFNSQTIAKGADGYPDMVDERSPPTITAPELSATIKDAFGKVISGTDYATPAIKGAIQNITDYLDNSTPGKPATASPILSADGTPMRTVPGTPDTPIPNDGQPFTVNDLSNFKNKINDGLNWAADSPGAKTMQKIWNQVDDQVESKLGETDSGNTTSNILSTLVEPFGEPGTLPTDLTDQWLDAKSDYANSTNVLKALQDQAVRKISAPTSKLDALFPAAGLLIGGGAGGAEGGLLGMIAAPIARDLLRNMGNPTMALGADAASGAVSNLGPIMAATAADSQTNDTSAPYQTGFNQTGQGGGLNAINDYLAQNQPGHFAQQQ